MEDVTTKLRRHVATANAVPQYCALYTAPDLLAAAGEIDRLRALLRRGEKQIMAWATKYGEHNPQWLPPAGDTEWLMDIEDALAPNDRVERPGAAVCDRSARTTGCAANGTNEERTER